MGELAAWIIGWDLILEYGISVAAVAVGWGQYFNDLLDNFLGVTLPDSLANPPGEEGGKFNLPAVFLVLSVTALLIYGVRETARANTVMVFIKVGIVLLFIVLAFTGFDAGNLSPFAPEGFNGIVTAASVIFFAYIGFDAISTSGEETKNPQKHLPIAILGALGVCTVLYILVALTASAALPYKDLAGQEAPLAEVLRSLDMDWGATVISIGALIAITSVVLTILYGQTRIMFAMSRDGLVPRGLAKISATRQTPARITAGFGIFIALIAAFVPLSAIVELVNIGTLFAFVVTNIGVIVLRRTRPDLERGFRVPWVPVVPIIGALLAIYLMTRLEGATWWRFAIWMALGLLDLLRLRHTATRGCARARSRTPKRISSVPLVLQRPAGADRPRLDAVGARERLKLAVEAHAVELVRVPEPVERGQDARPDPLGLLEPPGGAQTAPAEPGVERPHGAAVVAVDAERMGARRERPQPEVGEDVRLAQPRRRRGGRVRLERVRPQQPAELRAGARHDHVAGLQRHDLRPEPLADERAPSRDTSRPSARSAATTTACVSASASGGAGFVPSART